MTSADSKPFSTSDRVLGEVGARIDAKHLPTVEVLVWTIRAGRQLDSWLSDVLSGTDLDTSEYTAISALWFRGTPHQMSAGDLADVLVQTTGGTTKTIRRLAERELIVRVADPADGRRALIELTPKGKALAEDVLEVALDAFELDIGDLDVAERSELGARMARLSDELSGRLRRR